MNDPAIMRMFSSGGAIVSNSHFVYSSGRHSSVYVNKDALYLYPRTISSLCQLIAAQYPDAGAIDAVVAPVLGGIVLTQWVACHLTARR